MAPKSKSFLRDIQESGRQFVSETGKKIREAKKYMQEKAIPAAQETVREVLPSRERRVWELGYEKDATPAQTIQFKEAEAKGDEATMNKLKDEVERARRGRKKPQGQNAVQQTDQGQ